MRPVQDLPHGGATRWMTAPLIGSQIYVDYGNVPGEWVPGDSLAGWEQYGVAFCVTGQMGGDPPWSSCCTPAGCIPVDPNEAPDPETYCVNTIGGTWHPEPCGDPDPDPCNPTGACCWGPGGFVIAGCDSDSTEADCTANHQSPDGVVSWNEGEDCSVCQARCCFENQETCSDEYEVDCVDQGGSPDLPNTTCDTLCPCTYNVPPNDDCAGADPAPLLQLGQQLVFTGNNACASDLGEGYGVVVWIAFELEVCMDVTIHACDNLEPIEHPWIYLLQNCSSSTQAEPWSFGECACGPNYSMPFAQMIAGTYYYPVVADPSDDPIGDYIITVVAGEPCGDPPPNDLCDDAIEVLENSMTPYTTALANTEEPVFTGDCGTGVPVPPEVNCGPERDIWYKYFNEIANPVCIELCTLPDYDSMLAVYGPYDGPYANDPTPCPALVELACDDDFCDTPGYGAPGRVLIDAARGKWYLIRVGGCGGAWGVGELTVTTLGAGVLCGPELGKCCYIDADGVQCVESTEAGCTTNVNGVWTAGLDCPSTPEADCPPTGRCCYMQGGNLVCTNSFETECDALGGEWTAGLSCADTCSPLGTCCSWDAGGDPICLDSTSEAVCTGLGGLWNEGLDCTADDPCPLGQCCYDPNPACVDTSEAACLGFWNGAWDSGLLCSTPCPPLGACCGELYIYHCTVTTEADCHDASCWFVGEDCVDPTAYCPAVPCP
jgi:hypothetical protein